MASINLNSNLVKTVMLKVIGDGGDANRMLDEIAAKAEALKQEHPELTVSVDRAAAMASAVVAKAEMRAIFEKDPIKVKVDVDQSSFGTFLKSLATRRGWGSVFGNVPAEAGAVGGWQGFVTSPAGVAAIAAAVVSASPLIVAALGGIVGGAGAAGAFKIASNANANLTTLQTAVTTAQTALVSAQNSQKFYPSPANAAALATAVANLATAQQAAAAYQKANGPALALYAAGQNLGTAASNAFMSAITSNATRTVQDRVGHGLGTGTHTEAIPGTSFMAGLSPIISQLTGFVRTVGPQLGAVFRASLPYVQGWVQILEGFASRVLPATTSALQHFARFMPDVVHFFNGLSDVVGAVIRSLGWLAETFGITGQDILRFVRDVHNWWDDLGKAAENIVNTILGWFKRLPGELTSIGKNVASAFLAGLESVPILGPVVSFFSSAVDHAKHALGISSPSTVAMGMGRNFTQGFYLGLTQAGSGVGVNIHGVGGGGGGGTQVVFSGPGAVQFQQLVRLLWPGLVLEVRNRGGGGKNSAQIALGQTH